MQKGRKIIMTNSKLTTEIKESEDKYRNLIENLNDLVYKVELKPQRRFVYVSPSVKKITGYTPEDHYNDPNLGIKICYQDDCKVLEKYFEGKGDFNKSIILQWVKNDGTVIWTEHRITPIYDEKGCLKAVEGIARDITNWKKLEEALLRKNEFESLLREISSSFIDSTNYDIDINKALEKIGNFYDADRSYVFSVSGNILSNTHEWCNKGVSKQIKNLQNIDSTKELPGFIRKIRKLKPFVVENVSKLPPKAKLEKRHFQIQDIKSLLVAPIIVNNQLKGFVGIDEVKREKKWDKNIQKEVLIIGTVFSNLEEKKKTENALKESEKKYKELIEQSTVSIDVYTPNGKPLMTNPAFKKLWGLNDEQLKVYYEKYNYLDDPQAVRLGIMPQVKKIFRGEDIGPITVKYDASETMKNLGAKNTRANVRWVQQHTFPVKNKEGKVQNIVIFCEDITERKKAEESLKESEERYRLLIENIPTVVWKSNKNGETSFISSNVEKVYGYTSEEIYAAGNKSRFGRIHPNDIKKVKEHYKKLFSENKEFNVEYRIQRKDGEWIWLSDKASAVYEKEGDQHAYGIFLDITERKRREKEIQKQFMKYDIEEGNCYIILEKTNIKSIRAFKDLLKIRLDGIIISREKEKNYKNQINKNFRYIWITEKQIKNTLQPNKIEKYIEKLKKSWVIFIDRLDYILQKIGFDKTLSLVQHLNEIAYLQNHVILITIDPATIKDDQLYLIEKELQSLEQKQKIKLNDDQIEVLKFVFEKNLNNIKPSYSDIGKYLSESKPTIRNKIRYLKTKGYLIESIKGNRKTLEISEKTRNILT
jgi:PAS domain S-box-containing protein